MNNFSLLKKQFWADSCMNKITKNHGTYDLRLKYE